MVLTFFTVVLLLSAFVLIFFVLLQDPKGGGAMGMFGGGGGSNTLFGSTGANNFFTQVTKVAAVVFAVTCIVLTYVISHPGESVLDKAAPGAPAANPIPVDKPGPDVAVPPSEPAAAPPAETK